jgi:hypothetical protein
MEWPKSVALIVLGERIQVMHLFVVLCVLGCLVGCWHHKGIAVWCIHLHLWFWRVQHALGNLTISIGKKEMRIKKGREVGGVDGIYYFVLLRVGLLISIMVDPHHSLIRGCRAPWMILDFMHCDLWGGC